MNRALRFSLMTATVSLGISALLAAHPARLYAEAAPFFPACSELRASTCTGDAGAACDLEGAVGRCVLTTCMPEGGPLGRAPECTPSPSPGPSPSGSGSPSDDAGACSMAPTPSDLSGAATGLSLATALVLGLRRRRASAAR